MVGGYSQHLPGTDIIYKVTKIGGTRTNPTKEIILMLIQVWDISGAGMTACTAVCQSPRRRV